MKTIDKAYKRALKRIEENNNSHSPSLDLSDLGLKSIPPEVWELTRLTGLYLNENHLISLSPKIGNLTELTELFIYDNLLTSLPAEIGKLAKLTGLYLNKNKLRSLPLELGKLTKLLQLSLSYNQLSSLPPEIGLLTDLTSLKLQNNNLTSLPSEIWELRGLTELTLSKNRLTSIPPEIGKLKKLKTLNLQDNQLTLIPRQLCDLNMEISIESNYGTSLQNNPLKVPPLEIINQGRMAVKGYFDAIEIEETTQLFEAKLLIVGQGGVGKTYLMNRLIYNEIDPNIISTEGIEINQWMIKTERTDKFRVNFWDFGGQEIYHATHQFFLTKRSLYLFIWEARTDADLLSFDYWLNTVKVLSDDSPVIVIQNKVDERKKSINQISWKKRFPNIVEFHDVSALTEAGIRSLKNTIIRDIDKLPHIGNPLPKSWIVIRHRLEGLKENYIAYSRYQAICDEFNMDIEQADRLSGYYHDLGVFLHFKESFILRNTIFLKPEWVTKAVYKVLDDQKVKNEYGKFQFNELGKIWANKSEFPVDKHIDLVELMKNFELCFELPGGREYIIPELLLANQPEFEWDFENNLRYKYIYDFMPAGVMTRFIVITHDILKEKFYWKDGVVLTWEKSEALIIKTDNRVIEVRIKGSDRKTLLGIIRRDMNHINSSFSNLEVNEMVPCICEECSEIKDPYFYPYQNLLKAREKKIKIECQKSFDSVFLADLLGGIEKEDQVRTPTKTQHIKVFLASPGDLREERQEVELFIGKENRKLIHQNIFLDLIIWEDLRHSFHGNRIQDYFNDKLVECDIFICMFFKKAGNFTIEEFEIAYKHFKDSKRPRYLYVFFKSGKVEIDEIDEDIYKIQELKNKIENAGQIYKSFDSKEDIILQLKEQLEKIVPKICD